MVHIGFSGTFTGLCLTPGVVQDPTFLEEERVNTKRQTIDELCRGGPWNTVDGQVTGADLRALYDAIAEGRQCTHELAGNENNRRLDRARQLLRSAKLIVFKQTSGLARDKKRWMLTGPLKKS